MVLTSLVWVLCPCKHNCSAHNITGDIITNLANKYLVSSTQFSQNKLYRWCNWNSIRKFYWHYFIWLGIMRSMWCIPFYLSYSKEMEYYSVPFPVSGRMEEHRRWGHPWSTALMNVVYCFPVVQNPRSVGLSRTTAQFSKWSESSQSEKIANSK